jgi:hypothetical protein
VRPKTIDIDRISGPTVCAHAHHIPPPGLGSTASQRRALRRHLPAAAVGDVLSRLCHYSSAVRVAGDGFSAPASLRRRGRSERCLHLFTAPACLALAVCFRHAWGFSSGSSWNSRSAVHRGLTWICAGEPCSAREVPPSKKRTFAGAVDWLGWDAWAHRSVKA